jgi:hypothetical protein
MRCCAFSGLCLPHYAICIHFLLCMLGHQGFAGLGAVWGVAVPRNLGRGGSLHLAVCIGCVCMLKELIELYFNSVCMCMQSKACI